MKTFKCDHCQVEFDEKSCLTLVIRSFPNFKSLETEYYCSLSCESLENLDSIQGIIRHRITSLATWIPVIKNLHDALIKAHYE